MPTTRFRSNRDLGIVSLLGIAVIVATVLLSDSGDNWLTGGSILQACFQSDPSLDFYAQGYAQYRSKKLEDTCSSDGVRLQQAYCKSSIKATMTPSFQCPYGCANGACIAPQANCGNGNIDFGEHCDDGNTADGDGCSASCFKEDGFSCKTVSVCSSED